MELAKEDPYHVSVLVSTKNRFYDLKECVDSILIQTVKPSEIILVDASDTSESMEMVKESLRGKDIKLTYYRQEIVAGKIKKTAAWNRALKSALGDIIIFLDDDVVLDKHYIYYILKTYCENAECNIVGVMGSFKNLKNGKIVQKRAVDLRFLERFFLKFFLLPHEERNGFMQPSGFPTYPSSENKTIAIAEIMPACNMSFKKDVFKEFSFDEWFYGYSLLEDDDFTYRVSRKYKFLYTPFAELFHKSSKIAREHPETMEIMRVVNRCYFFKKNMPKTLKNYLAFAWAEFGILFLRFFSFNSFKDLLLSFIGLTIWENIPLIKTRMSAYYKILQSLIFRKRS